MEYFLAVKKKKILPFVTDSMDGPGEYYVKWNKPVRERQYHMIALICEI